MKSRPEYVIGLKELSKLGWYVTSLMSAAEIAYYSRRSNTKSPRYLDKQLAKYYSTHFEEVIFSLMRENPDRSNIILEASKAHKSRMYYCSTCLFLTQADSICKGELYKTAKSKKRLRDLLHKEKQKVDQILTVIMEESSIDAYFPTNSQYPSSLNRHGVLHGYSLDYGTKVNSLKALSLLAFVSNFK